MATEQQIELEVSAKIKTQPTFVIPITTYEEVAIDSISAMRGTIYSTLDAMTKGMSGTAKGCRFLMNGIANVPFTVIDIAMSYKEEGIMQATVTATLATGLTVTFGAMAATALTAASAPAIATGVLVGISCGFLNFGLSKLLDGIYDFAEEAIQIKNFNSDNNLLIFDTSISDYEDLKRAMFPLSDYILNNLGDQIDTIQVEQNIENEPITYTIQKGDTVWGICNQLGLTYDDLIALNPWLAERFSDDMKFALIRPGEKLILSTDGFECNPNFNEYFNEAQITKPIVIDPILVDLNGDGIKTTSVEDRVYFDHENDGFKEKSAWVDVNDGMLVIDKNNDGVINNGNEVFGDSYVKTDGSVATSGFDALKDLDSNNDGVINSSDAEFSKIKILKGDGSLISLEEAGIASIRLNSSISNTVDENGNTIISTGTFVKTDGTTGQLGDYTLKVDKFDSVASEILPETEEIAALPDVMGSGTMYSLHQAILRDESGELKTLVQKYLSAQDMAVKRNTIVEILYKWTNAENIADGSRGQNFDAKKLHVLEQFMGIGFIGVDGKDAPNNQACNFLHTSFETLCNYVASVINSQTSLKELYNLINFVYDFDSNKTFYDLSKAQEYLDNLIGLNADQGKQALSDFSGFIQSIGLKNQSNYEGFYNHYASMGNEYKIILDISDKVSITGTEGDDEIEGTALDEVVYAGSGDDVIYTRQGNDIVYGGDGDDYIDTCQGDDIIYGGAGNDTIITGEGNDIVYGGDGNDTITSTGGEDYIIGEKGDDVITGNGKATTYEYNLGDGNDIITDYNTTGSSNDYDTIIFGEGITKDNIEFLNGGNSDMLIKFKDHDGSIRIKKGLTNYNYKIENYQFFDGTKLTYDEIKFLTETRGTDEDDILTDTSLNEKIYGYDGNDTITSTGGQDYIIGGKGDDTITGNNKATTYEYNLGDGNDIITDYNMTGSINDYDTIVFGEGITKDNILFINGNNDDLLIKFKDHDGSIRIKKGLTNYNYKIENYQFFDGTKLTYDEIKFLTETRGTDEDDILTDSSLNEKIYGYDGNDTITSISGIDYIAGGKGDDIITGNGSATTYEYNLGDGNDTITDYNMTGSINDYDTIVFGEGITKDNIEFLNGGNSDMLIKFKDHDGSIRIKKGLTNYNYKIENYQFADGTSYTYDEIRYLTETRGTAGNDTITDTSLNEKIYGYDGNDTITSIGGQDYIVGGKGDDVITGNGSATTYEYNLGDGNDTITDYNMTGSRNDYDTIIFGEGISKDNILFANDNGDLLITFDGFEGSIRVVNGVSSSNYHIENYKFADNSSLTYDQVRNLLTATAAIAAGYDTGAENNTNMADYDVNLIIQDMSSYGIQKADIIPMNENNYNKDLMALVASR